MKKVKAILVLTLAALILVGCGPKTIAPTEVVLSETEVTLEDIGKTYQIQATVKPDDTTDKTLGYESADTTICTVDGNGLVTAVAPGETTVKVSCGEISASLKVKVNRVKKVTAVYYNVLVECAEEYYPTLTLYDDMTFQYMENFYQGMTKLTGTYTKVEQEYILTVTEQNTYGESVSVSWPEIRLMILNDNYLHLMTKMSMSQYYDVLSKDKKVVPFETYYIDDPGRVSEEYRDSLTLNSDCSFVLSDNFFEGFEILKGAFDTYNWPVIELNITERTNRNGFKYDVQLKVEETQEGLKLLSDLHVYKKGEKFSSFERHIKP